MLCPACSHDAPAGAKFCTNCGHRFAVEAAAPTTPPAAAPAGRSFLDMLSEQPDLKPLHMALIACGSMIAIVAAGAYFMSTAKPVERPAPLADVSTAAPAADATAAIERLPPSLPADDLARVCRAGIAHAFQRKPSIVKVVDNSNGLARVWYRRPEDGKRWTFDCKTDGKRILWRTVDAFGDNGPGRWRITADDEVLLFDLKGSKVKITSIQPDGSSGSETYTVGGK